jgi:hypothetical protein
MTLINIWRRHVIRILVALQHQLSAAVLIRELDTTILRTRDDPLAIMRDGHREHVVLMAGEVQHALAVGGERDRIYRVAGPAEAVDECRGRDRHTPCRRWGRRRSGAPSTHASSCPISAPSCRPSPRARARDDERAVVRKVERVNFLLVAFERLPNAFAGDIPYLCGRKWKGYQSATRNRRKWRRTRISQSSAPAARYFHPERTRTRECTGLSPEKRFRRQVCS